MWLRSDTSLLLMILMTLYLTNTKEFELSSVFLHSSFFYRKSQNRSWEKQKVSNLNFCRSVNEGCEEEDLVAFLKELVQDSAHLVERHAGSAKDVAGVEERSAAA